MCGIFFAARPAHDFTDTEGYEDINIRLREANAARGPDAQNSCELVLGEILLNFFGSELRLRGNAPVVQPHTENGNFLCWNGEIFEGLNVSSDENDGVKLFQALNQLSNPEEIPALFGDIEGPYAFVFYHAASNCLIFARDPLGRRSLLIHKPSEEKPYFFLASVSVGPDPGYAMEELSTEIFYSLDFQQLGDSKNLSRDFQNCLTNLKRAKSHDTHPYAELPKVNRELPRPEMNSINPLGSLPDDLSGYVDRLVAYLDASVRLRVRDIPRHKTNDNGQARVAVLFSGGIDSAILTLLAHRHLPIDEPIDLLNVAFENPRKMRADSQSSVEGLSKKQKKAKLRDSVPRESKAPQPSYLVPDRVTGLDEVEELRRLCPGRIWNFVEVNVPYEDSQAARPVVEHIMHPCNTIMDLSLAIALYFASRGSGKVKSQMDGTIEPYTSTARVLLNGFGSDELLGGYARHRTTFNRGGWHAIIDELQVEIDRIPTRNLGRDDRIISSHGKEARHPFLSLSLVKFLASLPVCMKMDPRLDAGVGDKMLLRLAARKLGLVDASERKKRAMQFGTHSAKMEAGPGGKKGDYLLPT